MPRMSQAEYQAYLMRESTRTGATSTLVVNKAEHVESESDLHSQIIGDCKRRGWLWVHARMDKASHLTIGAPDFLIFADGGRLLMVECKTRTGKLRPEQQAFHAMAAKLGHKAHVIRSMEEFLTLAGDTKL